MRKPLSRRRSLSAAAASRVPTRLAMTPPRSMSPISTTGTSAASAKPILAMSPSRRLTSAGLPAPSTSTRSASSRTVSEALQHLRQQRRLQAMPVARPWHCPRPCPGPRPARRSRSAASAAPGSCAREGATPQARACSAWARPISPPSAVTAALFDMFCGLNGRTRKAARVEGARQPGDDQRLADIGAGALEHDGGGTAMIRTRSPPAPSRRSGRDA